jgi:predicted RNA binding protein YcfA (HicA-like mRNA interferase family)
MKIRDVLKRLVADGWYVHRIRGSHRILKHPRKDGTVVVAGHPSKDIAIGTLKSVWKQAELEE